MVKKSFKEDGNSLKQKKSSLKDPRNETTDNESEKRQTDFEKLKNRQERIEKKVFIDNDSEKKTVTQVHVSVLCSDTAGDGDAKEFHDEPGAERK